MTLKSEAFKRCGYGKDFNENRLKVNIRADFNPLSFGGAKGVKGKTLGTYNDLNANDWW